jgi:hypothetical protein
MESPDKGLPKGDCAPPDMTPIPCTPPFKSEVTLHLREIPVHKIKDSQIKELSTLFEELGVDSVFTAAEEVHQNVDLSGAIFDGEWKLDSLLAHDNHSDLYSVSRRTTSAFPVSGLLDNHQDVISVKQGKPIIIAASPSSEYLKATQYEGRVFTFDGIPDSIAVSRRRNFRRLSKSVRIICTKHEEGKTVLIYEPKPRLLSRECRADRQEPSAKGGLVLATTDTEQCKSTQQKDKKRAKQQERRQQQREMKRQIPPLDDVIESQAITKSEPRRKNPSPSERSLKFVSTLFNFDNPQVDSANGRSLSDEQWHYIVRQSPTLKQIQSSNTLSRAFETVWEMTDFIGKMMIEISDLHKHNKRLTKLILASKASDDWHWLALFELDSTKLLYVYEILPLLVDAAKDRQKMLEEREKMTLMAYKIWNIRATNVETLQNSRDELSCSIPRETARKNKMGLKKMEQNEAAYKRAVELESQAWIEYHKLLKDTNPEIL